MDSKARIMVSVNNITYAIGEKIGGGGVAVVFACKKLDRNGQTVYDGLAYKEFRNAVQNTEIIQRIRQNIEKLIANPLKKGQNYYPHFVRPLDIINLKDNNFGYIMERVDLNEYLSLTKLIRSHPDLSVLCRFCSEYAEFFDFLHLSGYSYKDINEGNVYLKPSTGDFYIIDVDNIGSSSNHTIAGTQGYQAPEIYNGQKPNAYTDNFSLAVYFFRLFVGGFPFDGPGADQYMLDNDLDLESAAPTIYGSQAVFGFHPTDRSNDVSQSSDSQYRIQTQKWNILPKELQKCFIKTFVDAISHANAHNRTRPDEWKKCFDKIVRNYLTVCPKCGRNNFNHLTHCCYCGETLLREYCVFRYSVVGVDNQMEEYSFLMPVNTTVSLYNRQIFRIDTDKDNAILTVQDGSMFSVYEKGVYRHLVNGDSIILTPHRTQLFLTDRHIAVSYTPYCQNQPQSSGDFTKDSLLFAAFYKLLSISADSKKLTEKIEQYQKYLQEYADYDDVTRDDTVCQRMVRLLDIARRQMQDCIIMLVREDYDEIPQIPYSEKKLSYLQYYQTCYTKWNDIPAVRELLDKVSDEIAEIEKNNVYTEAVSLYQNAKTESDYTRAKEKFLALSSYRDSTAYLPKCDVGIIFLNQKKIYQEGMQYLKNAKKINLFNQSEYRMK